MRTKILVGIVFMVAVIAVSVSAVPSQRNAVVRFLRPTIIAGAVVLGPVVFEHDDARMARGEPCTHVYRYDTKRETKGELVVAFHCVPKPRESTGNFEATVSKTSPGGPDYLVEYQFADDIEGHGVPYRGERVW